LSVHVGPLAFVQSSVPWWHTPGLHAEPCTQAMQPPAPSHTLPAPHDVPVATKPDCMQTAAPLLQSIIPVLQAPEVGRQD
jgi:hypothetical protein